MSSGISIKVGSVTSTIALNNTDGQVANILSYFIEDWAGPVPDGMTQAQANQWKLDQATQRIVNYVRQTAQQNRLRDLQAQQQSLSDQATSDTQL